MIKTLFSLMLFKKFYLDLNNLECIALFYFYAAFQQKLYNEMAIFVYLLASKKNLIFYVVVVLLCF
jgi:hypothetical protein